jgi:hypothetical protein
MAQDTVKPVAQAKPPQTAARPKAQAKAKTKAS